MSHNIVITPIEDAKHFTAYNGLFSKKMYLNKTSKSARIYHDGYSQSNMLEFGLSLKKSANTIGVYECYGLTKYGFTKKEMLEMDKAYLKCMKPNFDWMDIYNFAELMYKTIVVDKRFSSVKNDRLSFVPCIYFNIKQHSDDEDDDNYWDKISLKISDDIDKISDEIELDNGLDYKDYYAKDKWNKKWPKIDSIKTAFAAIFDAFDIDNLDISKATVTIELNGIDFDLDRYDVDSMTQYQFISIKAAKTYKDIYTKAFPNIKYPSLYKFWIKTAFGISDFFALNKDRHTAYKDFIAKAKTYKVPTEECSYGCEMIWEPCTEEEGEQLW